MTIKAQIGYNGKQYFADLSQPLDISIPLRAGSDNPNCYYADPVDFGTIRSGDFVGSVAEGGSVNYQKVTLTPHGNGTHTECYGHISAEKGVTINQCLKKFHFLAQVITVMPVQTQAGDLVVSLKDIKSQIKSGIEALIIRTLPNDTSKTHRKYSGTNPCYLQEEVGEFLRKMKIKHLLIDLPSVDKEIDEGKLLVHRTFWNIDSVIRKDCTITELVFVDDDITDGMYLLNLQIMSLESDASPSKPLLFKISES